MRRPAVRPVHAHLGQALGSPRAAARDGTDRGGLGLWQGREGAPGGSALTLAAGWRCLPARPPWLWG